MTPLRAGKKGRDWIPLVKGEFFSLFFSCFFLFFPFSRSERGGQCIPIRTKQGGRLTDRRRCPQPLPIVDLGVDYVHSEYGRTCTPYLTHLILI